MNRWGVWCLGSWSQSQGRKNVKYLWRLADICIESCVSHVKYKCCTNLAFLAQSFIRLRMDSVYYKHIETFCTIFSSHVCLVHLRRFTYSAKRFYFSELRNIVCHCWILPVVNQTIRRCRCLYVQALLVIVRPYYGGFCPRESMQRIQ